MHTCSERIKNTPHLALAGLDGREQLLLELQRLCGQRSAGDLCTGRYDP
jgi:hypothetical protein